MRQVGVKAATSAIVVDPRRHPIAVRRRDPHALAPLKRLWVLHRTNTVRVGAAVTLALMLALVFQARGGIAEAVTATSSIMQGEFADAGLGISQISITGQSMTREGDVLLALGINDRTAIFGFDIEQARQAVLALPSVKSVDIRKVYPDQLLVSITEREAVARWTVDGSTFVIDAAGYQIAKAQAADSKLPLVIGDGAADDALVIIRAIGLYPDLSDDLAAISRLADRRWDLIYRSGLRVRLPENGVAQALKELNGLETGHQILERDLAAIDLRVPGMVVVQPNPAEDETRNN